jgi:hypothetical protein
VNLPSTANHFRDGPSGPMCVLPGGPAAMVKRNPSEGVVVRRHPDDMDLVFEATRAFVRRRYPTRELAQVDLRLDNGAVIRLPVPDALCAELRERLTGGGEPRRAPAAGGLTASHSADFRTVHWFGTDYALTEKQAKVVEALWQAREAGDPEVGQDVLLRACGSDGVRLVDLFRRSPAWGTLIVSARAGLYRLAAPPEES